MDGFELNKSSFTKEEIAKHKRANISKSINKQYTLDSQLAIIFNALELIVDSMPNCEHKTELETILAFRKEIKNNL